MQTQYILFQIFTSAPAGLTRSGTRSSTSPMVSRPNRRAAALLALLLSAAGLQAQTYSIDWFASGSGGGVSTGGSVVLSATIGQPAANSQPMSGGNFSLLGGFWSLLAVQTPEAPFLIIRFNPQFSAATVSWPSPSSGFVLEQKTDLNGSNWSAVPETVTDNGTSKFISVNPSGGNRFFRLHKP